MNETIDLTAFCKVTDKISQTKNQKESQEKSKKIREKIYRL